MHGHQQLYMSQRMLIDILYGGLLLFSMHPNDESRIIKWGFQYTAVARRTIAREAH